MISLFYIFVALNVVDVVLTSLVLRRGGSELNPVMNALMKAMPPDLAMLAIKAPVLMALYLWLDIVPVAVLKILVAGYLALAAWNLTQLIGRHQDKALHFAAGVFIAFLFAPLGMMHAFLATLAAGALKEIYDRLFGGSVELLDVVATAAGGAIAVGILVVGAGL